MLRQAGDIGILQDRWAPPIEGLGNFMDEAGEQPVECCPQMVALRTEDSVAKAMHPIIDLTEIVHAPCLAHPNFAVCDQFDGGFGAGIMDEARLLLCGKAAPLKNTLKNDSPHLSAPRRLLIPTPTHRGVRPPSSSPAASGSSWSRQPSPPRRGDPHARDLHRLVARAHPLGARRREPGAPERNEL